MKKKNKMFGLRHSLLMDLGQDQLRNQPVAVALVTCDREHLTHDT